MCLRILIPPTPPTLSSLDLRYQTRDDNKDPMRLALNNEYQPPRTILTSIIRKHPTDELPADKYEINFITQDDHVGADEQKESLSSSNGISLQEDIIKLGKRVIERGRRNKVVYYGLTYSPPSNSKKGSTEGSRKDSKENSRKNSNGKVYAMHQFDSDLFMSSSKFRRYGAVSNGSSIHAKSFFNINTSNMKHTIGDNFNTVSYQGGIAVYKLDYSMFEASSIEANMKNEENVVTKMNKVKTELTATSYSPTSRSDPFSDGKVQLPKYTIWKTLTSQSNSGPTNAEITTGFVPLRSMGKMMWKKSKLSLFSIFVSLFVSFLVLFFCSVRRSR